MKLNIMALLLCMWVTCGSAADAAAQQTDTGWTLRECIEYARQNNLFLAGMHQPAGHAR